MKNLKKWLGIAVLLNNTNSNICVKHSNKAILLSILGLMHMSKEDWELLIQIN
jgi:hypothetical protein